MVSGIGVATGFWMFAALTIFASVAAITARSPIYCAIWFAVSLLGTAGLMLLQGAQFLGLATAAVYAGAIVVTFLFLLMLSQPEGDTFYDRITWGRVPRFAASAIAVLFAVLMVGQVHQISLPETTANGEHGRVAGQSAAASARTTGSPRTEESLARADIRTPEHVAVLGSRLFSRHLVAVQVAATLLLVALVGAIAIVSRDHNLENLSRGG